MKRFPSLTVQEINRRLRVDCVSGKCYWNDATKYHKRLVGEEAGGARTKSHGDNKYWIIKINGIPYKRSQIVLAVSTGRWPEETVDHVNGNKLDDRACNLRHASVMQNNWNHKKRAKTSPLPMGIRKLPSGRFQARIGHMKKQIVIGAFDTTEKAKAAYIEKRKELFGDYA